VSLVARTVMVTRGISPIAIYALTFTRWDGLAVGALVAIVGRERGGMERLARWSAPVLLVGGLACVGFLSAAPYRSHYGVGMQTTGYAVLALTFGALLVQAIRAPAASRLHRALSDRRLAFFGRYSYGIYVLHGPLLGWLAAMKISPRILPALWGSALPGQAVFAAIALALCVAAALASWTLLERPFLSLKRYFPAANLRLAPTADSAGDARDGARAAA
jgi:peptidoglycan/LPS O-acetylase OafA/YrhL